MVLNWTQRSLWRHSPSIIIIDNYHKRLDGIEWVNFSNFTNAFAARLYIRSNFLQCPQLSVPVQEYSLEMDLQVILVSLLWLFCAADGQNSTAKECTANKAGNDADTCLMHLLLVGDPKYVFPENKEQMSKHCKWVLRDDLVITDTSNWLSSRLINRYEKCIKDYSSKCLSAFPRQVTSVLAYGEWLCQW